MRALKKGFKFFFAVFITITFSCASSPERKIDSMYVMVYDYDNSEVMNVSVYIDEKVVGVTDIYGRLMIPCCEQKEVKIRAEKKGYETLETEEVIKAGILVYFKMGSGSYYAEKAEQFFDEKNTESALKMINKALDIEERKDWKYLKEIIVKEIENER